MVCSDKIIIEKVLGSLWMLIYSKLRWSKNAYDDFFRIEVTVTNLHVKCSPLRAGVGENSRGCGTVYMPLHKNMLRTVNAYIVATKKNTILGAIINFGMTNLLLV